MTYNDILRRFRYALNINDPMMMEIFKHGNYNIDVMSLKNLLKKEDEQGYAVCSGKMLASFLDGFIVHRRGTQGVATETTNLPAPQLTNNLILRKIRIALELKDDEMLRILSLADINISKSELSAFFRNKEHKNYKACGDQFLRNFLKGLAVRHRDKSSKP